MIKKLKPYKADFKSFDVGRYEWVIEDVKSPITKAPVYRLKKENIGKSGQSSSYNL